MINHLMRVEMCVLLAAYHPGSCDQRPGIPASAYRAGGAGRADPSVTISRRTLTLSFMNGAYWSRAFFLISVGVSFFLPPPSFSISLRKSASRMIALLAGGLFVILDNLGKLRVFGDPGLGPYCQLREQGLLHRFPERRGVSRHARKGVIA